MFIIYCRDFLLFLVFQERVCNDGTLVLLYGFVGLHFKRHVFNLWVCIVCQMHIMMSNLLGYGKEDLRGNKFLYDGPFFVLEN
jgi:hypothetical protein